MRILNNLEFYVCDRKQCVPCDPNCQYTTSKKHAVNPDKPMSFGDDVVAVALEEKAGEHNE